MKPTKISRIARRATDSSNTGSRDFASTAGELEKTSNSISSTSPPSLIYHRGETRRLAPIFATGKQKQTFLVVSSSSSSSLANCQNFSFSLSADATEHGRMFASADQLVQGQSYSQVIALIQKTCVQRKRETWRTRSSPVVSFLVQRICFSATVDVSLPR